MILPFFLLKESYEIWIVTWYDKVVDIFNSHEQQEQKNFIFVLVLCHQPTFCH